MGVDPFHKVHHRLGGRKARSNQGHSVETEDGIGRYRFGPKRALEADFDFGGTESSRLNLARRTSGDDAALVDDGDLIAESFGFFDLVRGENDRSLVLLEFFNQFVNLVTHLRIEARCGLIEEHDLRIVN